MASSIILTASCTSLSSKEGMPNGRFLPFFLVIYTLFAGLG